MRLECGWNEVGMMLECGFVSSTSKNRSTFSCGLFLFLAQVKIEVVGMRLECGWNVVGMRLE